MVFPAAGLADPAFADLVYPADPAETVDAPGAAVADPALGAALVAACWLCWEAADAADDAAVGVDQLGCVKFCSSTPCEAVAGNCRSADAAVF